MFFDSVGKSYSLFFIFIDGHTLKVNSLKKLIYYSYWLVLINCYLQSPSNRNSSMCTDIYRDELRLFKPSKYMKHICLPKSL